MLDLYERPFLSVEQLAFIVALLLVSIVIRLLQLQKQFNGLK